MMGETEAASPQVGGDGWVTRKSDAPVEKLKPKPRELAMLMELPEVNGY